VGTGIAVAIPEGTRARHAASGLAAEHGITIVNTPGSSTPATGASCA
jgi:dUTPase